MIVMYQLYWNIDPEKLVSENNAFNDCTKKIQKNILLLIEEYKAVSNEIKKYINQIENTNFEEYMSEILDREAYLAEIYFYLTEDILNSFNDEDILAFIKKEYLLSYEGEIQELDNFRVQNGAFLFKNWFKRKLAVYN